MTGSSGLDYYVPNYLVLSYFSVGNRDVFFIHYVPDWWMLFRFF